MNFKQYIEESINDKGILKCIFMAGSPGSGKSWTISKINNPTIQPRLVSIDKIHEHLGPKKGIALSDYESWNEIEKDIKGTFREQLALYINSLLPLWVDGTSSELNSTLRRVGLLEYFGYDVGMLWVNTDVNVAIRRAAQRQRRVPEDFIRRAHAMAEENKQFYKTKVKHFFETNNNDGEFNDGTIQKLFKSTTNFFLSPIENPVGNRIISDLKRSNAQFLVPTLYSKEELLNALQVWYRTN